MAEHGDKLEIFLGQCKESYLKDNELGYSDEQKIADLEYIWDDISYEDLPQYYSWTTAKRWKRRTKHFRTIGRLQMVSPMNTEKHCLRLLLKFMKRPVYPDGAKSVYDGLKVHPTKPNKVSLNYRRN